MAHAARGLAVARSVLGAGCAPGATACPGNGQMRADLAGIAALRKEAARSVSSGNQRRLSHGGMRSARIAGTARSGRSAGSARFRGLRGRACLPGSAALPAPARDHARRVTAIETRFRACARAQGARRLWRDVLERAAPDRTAEPGHGHERAPRVRRGTAEEWRRRAGDPPRQENRRGLDRTFQGEPEMAGPHHLPLARRRLAPCPVVPDPGARRAAGWPMKADRDASLIVGKCLMCGLGSCIDRAESAQFEALI